MAKTPKIRDLTASAAAGAPSIRHPLAGQQMTGAQMIVQVLADEGVSTIFGYSGGAILPTYDAVFLFNEARALKGEPQMPLIVPANEQGAGFRAAGYARAIGRVSFSEAEEFFLDLARQQVLSIGERSPAAIAKEQMKIWSARVENKNTKKNGAKRGGTSST